MASKNMATELVILMGLQASGKTTFRRARFDATHVVVSKDDFRNNRRPERRQRSLIEDALSSGRAVVVDNTNVRREDRLRLIEQAKAHSARIVGYFFVSSLEASLERNATRTGRELVRVVGVKAAAKALVVPSLDEGFDELYEVRISPGGFDVQNYGATSR
jgi:predicted kinase